jgi:hypothetical protein
MDHAGSLAPGWQAAGLSTAAIVWIVVAVAAAVAMGIVVRTRWLQSRTLEKCIALSLVLHAVLAVACSFIGGLTPASRGRDDHGPVTMLVMLAEAPGDETASEPLEAVAGDAVASVAPPSDAAPQEPFPGDPAPVAMSASLAALAAIAAAAPAELVPLLDSPEVPVADAALQTHAAERHAMESGASDSSAIDAGVAASTASVEAPKQTLPAASPAPPAIYASRLGAARLEAALARGGSMETERAVQAALAWLTAAQSADGRWDAARHGAGQGRRGGQHDPATGGRSDHGVTGLALLAFLGAGSTHREGLHAEVVDRGIRFLVSRQRADGSLAGDADFFAALYCHGMATLALAECVALSGDADLRPPLERAVRHTLAMQHPVTGGWRYAAGDRGDTSQLGWQVMVLATARQAGLDGLDRGAALARGFLPTVSSGASGGLASYRPRERPNQAMTAEALVCRLFLGLPVEHPVAREAIDFVSRNPPSRDACNIYTWYYATLAAFHVGGPQWDRWNAHLVTALLPLQRRESGALAGSWDPDPVWGGHGGRVYSTALSALALEVYYRHEPVHARGPRMAAVPP